jgi:hypothetical protein
MVTADEVERIVGRVEEAQAVAQRGLEPQGHEGVRLGDHTAPASANAEVSFAASPPGPAECAPASRSSSQSR